VPNHPFLPFLAGHSCEQFHDQGYEDALEGEAAGLDLPGFLRRTNARHLVLSGTENPDVRGWVSREYRLQGPVPFRVATLTGFPSTPSEHLVRRDRPARHDVRVVFDPGSGLAGFRVQGQLSVQRWGDPDEMLLSTWGPDPGGSGAAIALSPPFSIESGRIDVHVGGGRAPTCRVELTVGSQVVRTASGVGSAVRTPTTWDVGDLRGREARLRVVDEAAGEFGWVLLGRVESWNP